MKLTINCTDAAAHIVATALRARITEIRDCISAADGMNTDGYLRAIFALEGSLFQIDSQIDAAAEQQGDIRRAFAARDKYGAR